MKPALKLIVTLAAAFLFYACGESEEKEECAFIPETTNTVVELDYTPLSDSLVNLSSKAQLVKLLGEHQPLRDYFFRRDQYPNDSAFVNELYRRYASPHIDTLLMETHRVFGDESQLKSQFTEAFKNLRYYYPDIRIPKIETVVTGFENDMFVSDSLIIVSLDYFLGPGAKYRPNMYEYLLRQYGKENIVPSPFLMEILLNAVSNKHI